MAATFPLFARSTARSIAARAEAALVRSGLPGDAGKLLVNLLSEDHSSANDRGKHTVVLEPYGYRWYRVGGLDYLLKRSDIDADAAGKTGHPA